MNGTVKWFNAKKGYGFIVGEDNNEYFVHYSNICSDKKYKLLNNDTKTKVTFDLESREDGKQFAVNVKEVA